MEVAVVAIVAGALFELAVAYAIARRVFTGLLTPMDVHKLVEAQQTHIAELREQNTALRKEREFDRSELTTLMRQSIEAMSKVHQFLSRYEALGGFASPPRPRPESNPAP